MEELGLAPHSPAPELPDRSGRGLGRMDGAGGDEDRGPKKGEVGASRKPELRCKASRRPTFLIPLREGGIPFE